MTARKQIRVTREKEGPRQKKVVQNGSIFFYSAFGAVSSFSFKIIKCKHFCQEKAQWCKKENKLQPSRIFFLPIAQNAKEEEEEAFTSPALFNKIHWNLVGGSSKVARQLRCRHKKGIRSFEADRSCDIRHERFLFIPFITLVTPKTLIPTYKLRKLGVLASIIDCFFSSGLRRCKRAPATLHIRLRPAGCWVKQFFHTGGKNKTNVLFYEPVVLSTSTARERKLRYNKATVPNLF